MSNPADEWQQLASRLGFKVITPANIPVGDRTATFTALLPQFGGKHGMLADADWGVISPHADELLKLGYGFSAVEIGGNVDDDESAKNMLRDWGWSAAEPRPSWW